MCEPVGPGGLGKQPMQRRESLVREPVRGRRVSFVPEPVRPGPERLIPYFLTYLLLYSSPTGTLRCVAILCV